MFQTCQRCGNISIQRFNNEGTTVGVWILSAEASVMFRLGAIPNAVFDYVFSDDFFRNRGITLSRLKGYLKSMLDLSGFVNLLLTRLGRLTDANQVQLSLEILRAVLSEHAERVRAEDDARLNVSTLGPLADLMQGRSLSGQGTENRIKIRFGALEILESFVQPDMWDSVPRNETQALESALDHMNMVENSAARLRHFAENLDDEILIDAYVEAKFMYRLFRRRQARLSRAHSDAVWRTLRNVEAVFDVTSPLSFASKTFEALRALLVHQLVESGFFKVGQRTIDGLESTAFRSPNTGEVLVLPEHSARLHILATDRASKPSATLDSWTAALDRL